MKQLTLAILLVLVPWTFPLDIQSLTNLKTLINC